MGSMLDAEPACPKCARNDQVVRIAALYLASLEKKHPNRRSQLPPEREQGSGASSPNGSAANSLAAAEFEQQIGRLAPPTGSKKPTARLIHPDMVIGAFSLVAPVFIYGMATSQAGMLVIALPVCLALYVIYFWQRKALIVRYREQTEIQLRQAEDAQRITQRWMQARGCLRCGLAFIPGGDAIEAARFNELLHSRGPAGRPNDCG